MKNYKDFIPKDSAGLGLWAYNYKTRFPDIAPELPDAITPEDIAIQQKYAQQIINALNNVERMKAELAAAVSLKDKVVAENTRKMRNMAIKIKHSRNYDDSIGAALDIIYRGRTIYAPELIPDIKVVATTNFVEVHFTKSRAMGAVIFGRYPGGEWETLGKTRISPYIDNRPLKILDQPERREYMVRIWDGFQCIGQESQIVGVVFNG